MWVVSDLAVSGGGGLRRSVDRWDLSPEREARRKSARASSADICWMLRGADLQPGAFGASGQIDGGKSSNEALLSSCDSGKAVRGLIQTRHRLNQVVKHARTPVDL